MISADFIKFSTNANHWPVNEIYSKLIKNKLILRERERERRKHQSTHSKRRKRTNRWKGERKQGELEMVILVKGTWAFSC